MTGCDIFYIIISGAFGGILSAVHLNDGKIYFPRFIKIGEKDKDHWYMGILADIILGAGAGIIATIPLDLSFPKNIYVAIIAGFGGGNFIAKQAKQTEKERGNAEQKLPDINTPTPSNGMIDIEVDIDDDEESGGGEKL